MAELLQPTSDQIRDIIGLPESLLKLGPVHSIIETSSVLDLGPTADVMLSLDDTLDKIFVRKEMDILGNFMQYTERVTPANPPANEARFYAKDVGGLTKPMWLDSAGTETDLTAGGGGGEANTISSLGGGTVLTAAVPKLAVDLRTVSIATTAPITHSVATDLLTFDINDLVNADISATAAIVLTKLQNIATDRLLGRETAASGAIEEISLNATLELITATTLQRAALTGDVTATAGSNTTAIATGVIVNADINVSAGIVTTKLADSTNFVLTNRANTFDAFAQRFPTNQLQLDNPAGTFQYIFATSAITIADKTVTLPLLTANDTFVFNTFAATLANKTLTTPTIASFVNATHSHLNAAGGGTITKAAISDFAHQADHQSGGSDALTGNLDATARTSVSKNSAADVGARRTLNFIEGANVTLTIVDDGAGEEVDITIASTAGGGSPLTTKGDIFGFDTADNRILVGTNEQVLMADSVQALGVKYALVADANIAVHTSTKITITAKGQLNSAIVYTDQTNVFGDFNQDFKDNRIRIFNPADTFAYTFVAAAIVAARNITLPLLTANDIMVTEAFAQTLTNKTIDGDLNTIIDINETQMNVSVGASTTVLTSNGVGVAPTYQAPAGGEFTAAWTADHNQTGSGFALVDARFADATDSTKELIIDLAGNTTAIAGTLDFNFTTAKTITFPDATFTVVGKDTIDVFTNKSLDANGTGNVITNIGNAEIEAHTSTKITITAKGQLNSAIVYTDQINTFGDFVQTFKDNALHLENPAGTFDVVFQTSAEITSDRILTIPLLGANRTMVVTGLASQIVIGTEVTGASTALTDTADIAYLNTPNVYIAGNRQDFLGLLAGTAGLNVGGIAGNPTTQVNGDIWLNTSTNQMFGRVNGVNIDLGQSGSEVLVWTANHDANGFALLDARFADDVDATKILDLNLVGITTGIVGTLDFNFTTAKTITFPDATTTMVGTGIANQLTNTELTSGVFAKITGVGVQTQDLDMDSNDIILDAAGNIRIDNSSTNTTTLKHSTNFPNFALLRDQLVADGSTAGKFQFRSQDDSTSVRIFGEIKTIIEDTTVAGNLVHGSLHILVIDANVATKYISFNDAKSGQIDILKPTLFADVDVIFKDNRIVINSPDDLTPVTIVNSQQTLARNLTIPILTGNRNFLVSGEAQVNLTTDVTGLLPNANLANLPALGTNPASARQTAIVNTELSSGVFANITGIGAQSQTLDMNNQLVDNILRLDENGVTTTGGVINLANARAIQWDNNTATSFGSLAYDSLNRFAFRVEDVLEMLVTGSGLFMQAGASLNVQSGQQIFVDGGIDNSILEEASALNVLRLTATAGIRVSGGFIYGPNDTGERIDLSVNNQIRFRANSVDKLYIHGGINAIQFRATGGLNLGADDIGQLNVNNATNLTIVAGAITQTQTYHTVLAETGTADTLSTITAGNLGAGNIIILKADTGDTITVDNAGNILLAGGTMALTANDTITLIYDGINWREMARSVNS